MIKTQLSGKEERELGLSGRASGVDPKLPRPDTASATPSGHSRVAAASCHRGSGRGLPGKCPDR